MCAAANFAFWNRQVLTHRVRQAADRVLGPGMGARIGVVYDIAHNIAEEAPVAYKDVERVVDVVVRANVARKAAQLEPIGVIKG